MQATRPHLELTPIDVARLLAAAPSIQDKILLALIVGTPLRTHEVLALRWMDLDIERHVIVPHQVAIPHNVRALLLRRAASARPGDYLLFAPPPRRHLSPRDAAVILDRAHALSGIGANVSLARLERIDPRWSPSRPLPPTSAFRFAVPPPSTTPTALGLSVTLRPPSANGDQTAMVEITTRQQTVALYGVTVGPPDITVTVPPAESWRLALSRLPPDMRARVADVSFYQQLLAQVAQRHRDSWWRRPPSVLRPGACDA